MVECFEEDSEGLADCFNVLLGVLFGGRDGLGGLGGGDSAFGVQHYLQLLHCPLLERAGLFHFSSKRR